MRIQHLLQNIYKRWENNKELLVSSSDVKQSLFNLWYKLRFLIVRKKLKIHFVVVFFLKTKIVFFKYDRYSHLYLGQSFVFESEHPTISDPNLRDAIYFLVKSVSAWF